MFRCSVEICIGSLVAKISIPSSGPDDWQHFLAKPKLQWKKGYSARAAAFSWEAAGGLPQEIAALLETSGIGALQVLLIIPEHKVYLPPIQGHPSQNDVFALLKAADGELISMTVEAKVSESFDKTVGEWIADNSAGKHERLAFLREMLALEEQHLEMIRYQLLHRTASAILEAIRFNASYAVMVVQSFSQMNEWFDDYSSFLALFGIEASVGKLHHLGTHSAVEVYSGWVRGDPEFLGS